MRTWQIIVIVALFTVTPLSSGCLSDTADEDTDYVEEGNILSYEVYRDGWKTNEFNLSFEKIKQRTYEVRTQPIPRLKGNKVRYKIAKNNLDVNGTNKSIEIIPKALPLLKLSEEYKLSDEEIRRLIQDGESLKKSRREMMSQETLNEAEEQGIEDWGFFRINRSEKKMWNEFPIFEVTIFNSPDMRGNTSETYGVLAEEPYPLVYEKYDSDDNITLKSIKSVNRLKETGK
jgi:hypothetical protein